MTSRNSSQSLNVYEAMAAVIHASTEELLRPFAAAEDARGLLLRMSADEFFRTFLTYADKFSDRCCFEMAKVLRDQTTVSSVRAIPSNQLAKEIRASAFEKLDAILLDYLRTLRDIHIDLVQTAESLGNRSLADAILRGAALGQVAGGFGKSGSTMAKVGGFLSAMEEAAKQEEMRQRQQALEEEARRIAFERILEYLRETIRLPDSLLDFCCAKCLGAEVDIKLQQQTVRALEGSLKLDLQSAVRIAESLPSLEGKLEDERRTASALEEERKVDADMAKAKALSKKGMGYFLYLCTFVLGMASLGSLVGGLGLVPDEKETTSFGSGILGCIILLALAGGAFVSGRRLLRKVPDDNTPPTVPVSQSRR